MPARAIKAVLFDMDGVLVDVSRSYRRAVEETATHFTGRDLEAGTVQRYKNRGGFNDDWKLTHALVTDAGMDVPFSRVVEEFQKLYRGESWDGFIAEEPALISYRTLERLGTGRLMGVVTGRPEAEARWTVDRFGWKRYFPLVVAKEKQEGRGKPDPYGIQHALGVFRAAGFAIRPEEAVYIGDTVDDMQAARAAGAWAIGMVPPYLEAAAHAELLRVHGAHVVLTSCDDLPSLIDAFYERVVAPAREQAADDADEPVARRTVMQA